MMLFFAAGVLIIGIAFHVAWVGKRAEAKGRFVLGWVIAAVVLCAVGLKIGLGLFDRADAVSSDAMTFLYVTSPVTLSLAPLILVVIVLMWLPPRIGTGRTWPIAEGREGTGTLVILDDAVELRWGARTERIARATLTASADQESVRLAWPDHEVLVMPTGKPANREGRMRQAEAIAARLKR
ncbi:MAG: hypothetical protein JO257_25730 [Deltaproteobacteria bacterium]|nr:hypothetical protein [Deltaproteobacteria bacterium]